MIDTQEYMRKMVSALREAYGERLVYVGLQGSYLREEAIEDSDIEVMAVVDTLSAADLNTYKQVVRSMEQEARPCGFLCGKQALLVWNPLESSHVLHSTKDFYGELKPLLNPYTNADIANYISFQVGNVYHTLCHRYVYTPVENSVKKLPNFQRDAFFILQNLCYLEHVFSPRKRQRCRVFCKESTCACGSCSLMHPKMSNMTFQKRYSCCTIGV